MTFFIFHMFWLGPHWWLLNPPLVKISSWEVIEVNDTKFFDSHWCEKLAMKATKIATKYCPMMIGCVRDKLVCLHISEMWNNSLSFLSSCDYFSRWENVVDAWFHFLRECWLCVWRCLYRDSCPERLLLSLKEIIQRAHQVWTDQANRSINSFY